jgi:hypothetical protein
MPVVTGGGGPPQPGLYPILDQPQVATTSGAAQQKVSADSGGEQMETDTSLAAVRLHGLAWRFQTQTDADYATNLVANHKKCQKALAAFKKEVFPPGVKEADGRQNLTGDQQSQLDVLKQQAVTASRTLDEFRQAKGQLVDGAGKKWDPKQVSQFMAPKPKGGSSSQASGGKSSGPGNH